MDRLEVLVPGFEGPQVQKLGRDPRRTARARSCWCRRTGPAATRGEVLVAYDGSLQSAVCPVRGDVLGAGSGRQGPHRQRGDRAGRRRRARPIRRSPSCGCTRWMRSRTRSSRRMRPPADGHPRAGRPPRRRADRDGRRTASPSCASSSSVSVSRTILEGEPGAGLPRPLSGRNGRGSRPGRGQAPGLWATIIRPRPCAPGRAGRGAAGTTVEASSSSKLEDASRWPSICSSSSRWSSPS